MNRRNFLVQTSTLTVGALLVPSAFAQIQSMNEAINKSGRQRMLSQRMAKAYLQIGQGIAVERSRKILALSITIYAATVRF
jgi:nitrate/nitrite-specific signal transduction histidine kinase